MTPPIADTARPVRTSNRKAAPRIARIVPAVPLAYSKPSVPPKSNASPPDVTNTISARSPENGDTNHAPAQEQALIKSDESVEDQIEAHTIEPVANSEKSNEVLPLEEIVPAEVAEQQDGVQSVSQHTRKSSTVSSRVANELPPPFYPSEDRSTPTPTSTTSSVPFQNLPSNNVTMHHPRPSPSRIIFGGYADSSNTSPAPPPGMMPFQMPQAPPGYMPPTYGPPPFYPAHSHHLSDPHAGSMYPIMGLPHNGAGYRRDQPLGRQQPPWYPSEGLPYGARPQDFYYPRPPYGPPNGNFQDSRSPSQGSSRNQDQDTKRSDTRAPTQNGARVNGMDPISSSEMAPLYSLRDWLSENFGNQALADCILEVSPDPNMQTFCIPAHGVLLARSPVLRNIISQSMRPLEGTRVAKLQVPSQHFIWHSYLDALRVLYGGPLLTTVETEPLPPFNADGSTLAVASGRVEHALAYLVAGEAFCIPEVVRDGFTLVARLLRWDTIEKILDFVSNPTLFAPVPGIQPNTSFEGQKSSLLVSVLDFIAQNIPSDFKLNTAAPQLAASPRLPPLGDSRPNKHHPRLSQIRFGELPPDLFCVNLISSILISLPFESLKRLFEESRLEDRFSQGRLFDIGLSVIEERENRRKKLARGFQTHDTTPKGHPLWPNLLLEEGLSANTHAQSGLQLLRKPVNYDTSSFNGHLDS
ncbi:hypothetical protein EJ05DRAFT_535979 [Pseudovirgaria hyperparasitica]|uniref:BTB domain-containing protein n=1 Tax=Pseudovirgaria hyperparasitica TaxID=470096 RepID=A0A6A6WGH6_9PEZI|nr:uncharacterized protein EJ05DRAFT_535979 [Pseudovirgaria hyperparasitica]KAF2761150.1 hypothetical protein EJ05DRAFT_535979 [Pseudovirgaria hyperparasitica]